MSGMPADSGRGNEEGSWVRARRLSEQLLWLWVAAILYLGSSFSIHRGCVGLHVGYLRLAQPSCLALCVSQVLRCEGSFQQAVSRYWSSLTVAYRNIRRVVVVVQLTNSNKDFEAFYHVS